MNVFVFRSRNLLSQQTLKISDAHCEMSTRKNVNYKQLNSELFGLIYGGSRECMRHRRYSVTPQTVNSRLVNSLLARTTSPHPANFIDPFPFVKRWPFVGPLRSIRLIIFCQTCMPGAFGLHECSHSCRSG